MQCVYRSFDHAEAEIVANLLRVEGCPAYVFENGLSRLNWPSVIAYGGFRVVVADGSRNDAGEVLARWRRGDYCLDTSDNLFCPRCTSGHVEENPNYRGWAFVLPFFIGLPLFWPLKWRMRCKSCGFHWKTPPRQTYAAMSAAAHDAEKRRHEE